MKEYGGGGNPIFSYWKAYVMIVISSMFLHIQSMNIDSMTLLPKKKYKHSENGYLQYTIIKEGL